MEHSTSYNKLLQIQESNSTMSSSTCTQSTLEHASTNWHSSFPVTIQQADLLIEMYLNDQVFYHPSSSRNEQIDTISNKTQHKTQDNTEPSEESLSHSKNAIGCKKSIFHNFQKHLITIIKKYLIIPKNKLTQCQSGALSFNMWQAFIKTTSFNKRLLHTVFGVDRGNPPSSSLTLFFPDFPQISQVCSHYSWEQVLRAQNVIRECIVEQAGHLSKFFLKSNSNITKFDQFYAYYCNFIQEIRQGPMSKRMTKSTKKNLIENINQKRA